MATSINHTNPSDDGYAITAHDTNELSPHCRGIYMGDTSGGAALKVTTVAGATLTFAGVLQGTILPVRAKVVFDTGTTAASLIGLQ